MFFFFKYLWTCSKLPPLPLSQRAQYSPPTWSRIVANFLSGLANVAIQLTNTKDTHTHKANVCSSTDGHAHKHKHKHKPYLRRVSARSSDSFRLSGLLRSKEVSYLFFILTIISTTSKQASWLKTFPLKWIWTKKRKHPSKHSFGFILQILFSSCPVTVQKAYF